MGDTYLPWHHGIEDVAKHFDTNVEEGLRGIEAQRRLTEHGANVLSAKKQISALEIFIRQFKSLIVLLLIAAGAVAFAFGEIIDGSAIVAVIVLNAAIGFFTEIRAVRSMEALNKLSDVTSRVIRDDSLSEIPAESLVPGDLTTVEGGDVVSADMRLVFASKLQVDESALTGESLPVEKQAEAISESSVLAERSNMMFKGTKIQRGSGVAIVAATGMDTELGAISSLVAEAGDESTPLEERLKELGNRLIWVTLGIAAIVAASGIISGRDLLIMIETAIALAIAAIPEGLPIVATIALARGMLKMAKKNALINHLAAVETLGAVDVICTDKTGTLTENRMSTQELYTQEGRVDVSGTAPLEGVKDSALAAIRVGVLCNNASMETGDPMEIALLSIGGRAGIERNSLVDVLPEVGEEAFDSETKMMATWHERDSDFLVAVKGAPESVIGACTATKDGDEIIELTDGLKSEWIKKNKALAERGLRVLAFASKIEAAISTQPYNDLMFLGFVTFLDPPREDVKPAIRGCRAAGVRVIMITGDQGPTARTIAREIGLGAGDIQSVGGRDWKEPDTLSDSERSRVLGAVVFSRFSPRQKMDLIDMHQKAGSNVAMTGDGVNDAPALKKANIGIAMGLRGTQVAREAADMVLKDDAFATIVSAIRQGRIIFNNIRSFIVYLLSCNISEILVLAIASFMKIPLPLLPLQILFLNLVTDIFPALALGVGDGDASVMRHPPRNPKESIVTGRQWKSVLIFSVLISLSVLGSLAIALRVLHLEGNDAITISFLTLAFAQLWHVMNMRSRKSRLFWNEVVRNRFVWMALVLCVALLLAAVYLPGISSVLRLSDPDLTGWLTVIGMSLVPVVVGQILIKLGISPSD